MQPKSTGVEEPTLLCNQMDLAAASDFRFAYSLIRLRQEGKSSPDALST